MLVSKEANLLTADETSGYLTALHCAAQSGHVPVVTFLIEKGTDVDIEDANNETPLFKAAENEQVEAVKFLLSKKADVNHAGLVRTPLIAACDTGNLDLVKLFVEKGANVNGTGTVNKETALHVAAVNGHSQIVSFLLSKGANKSLRDQEDKTALDKATSEEVKKLLK